MASFSPEDQSDPRFRADTIGQNMRVPDRLTVQSRPQPGSTRWAEQRHEEEEAAPPAYNMTVPDRLRYTEAPDMSPRPMFGPSSSKAPSSTYWSAPLEPCWEGPTAPPPDGDPPQSPLRRSYSDQAFVPPSHHKQALLHHGHTPRGSSSSSSTLQHRSAPPTSPAAPPPHVAPPLPPPSLLSPHTVLQAARELGQHASQRLLQAIGHKSRSSPVSTLTPVGSSLVPVDNRKSGQRDSWSLDDEGGAAVEFIVLRRQVVKISRRLAGLERQNAERRNSEVVLFSLLISTCLLNAWLWIRR